MGKWNDYTTKTALKDNDELMILDKDANANKRTLMDKIWDYVVDKMTTAVIAKLGTTNKTLIGAVNELNSNQKDTDWVALNEQHYMFYRCKNGFVTIVINSNVELKDATLLCVLPNQCRPLKEFYVANYTGDSGMYVRANGEVLWNNTSTYNHCSITYPV